MAVDALALRRASMLCELESRHAPVVRAARQPQVTDSSGGKEGD